MARQQSIPFAQLCQRFGVSRKTGYKWLARANSGDDGWSRDRSRRPHRSPARTPSEIEALIVELRDKHPAWGGRKIRHRLKALGHDDLPAASTITEILRRHRRIDPRESLVRQPSRRFEREAPNQLWQMDFKGDFPTARGRCHPLTVVDDHSRYATCVRACGDQREPTVRAALTETFARYGVPERMLMDNGSCWGDPRTPLTTLGVWLVRLGVAISHPRPYHPQTQGKNERFNRTLKTEVIVNRNFHDLADCQREFDRWRPIYNSERPHEALAYDVPADRYRPSSFTFPESLPAIEYGQSDTVRKVHSHGEISFASQRWFVSRALSGLPVAVRPTKVDGVFGVHFLHQRVLRIDVTQQKATKTTALVSAPSPRGGGNGDQNRWSLTHERR